MRDELILCTYNAVFLMFYVRFVQNYTIFMYFAYAFYVLTYVLCSLYLLCTILILVSERKQFMLNKGTVY